MKGIFALKGIPEKLNEQWIADALAKIIDKEYTPWVNIKRLPPAHTLVVKARSMTQKRYWDLNPEKEIRFQKDSDYVEAFREMLIEAVRCRTSSIYPVGSELSGGLDSSAVAALGVKACKQFNVDFWSFSHVLSKEAIAKVYPLKDERAHGDLVRRFAGIENGCYITSEEQGGAGWS